jgi:C4-dicarboxylate-specific signal transduction histidine kinase
MNRFAHSVDAPAGPVDVSLLLRQVCELAERFAAMRSVALEAAPAVEPLSVVSAPFLLQNVAWLCLEFAMQAARAGERLILQADKTAGGVRIRIQAVSGLSREAMERFLTPARLTPLLQGLGAGLALDEERQRIELVLPNELTDR